MKTAPSFSAGRVLTLLLLLIPHAVSAQTSRGSTGAVTLLNKVSAAIAGASSIEYMSTVRSIDQTGRSVTLYVHAKIRKPMSVRVTVSTTGTDAPDATLIVSDSATITGFDPKLGLITHHPVDFSGPNLVLPPGFGAVEPAFPTVRQVFGSAPFDALFYGTAQSPMTLARHGVDIPGALLIDARWPTELVGQERLAKLYVNIDTATPRRLLLGSSADGSDTLQYVEDFTLFTINPVLADGTFRWAPPASQQPSPSAPASAAKSAIKHAKKPTRHSHAS